MLRKINRNKGENEESIVGTIIKNVENRYMPETISLWDQHVNISKVAQKQIKIVASATGKKKSRIPRSQIK